MAEMTIATISDAFKNFYLDEVRDMIDYESCPLYKEIEKNGMEVDGDTIKMAVKYGSSGGIGAGTEVGTLPTPNARKIKQVSYSVKNQFARLQISIKAMKASESKKAAFVKLMEMYMEDLTKDAKKYYGRQLHTGNSGKIATCTAEGPVTTLTLTSTGSTKDTVKFFEEGMLIDICASDGTVKVTGREVTSVDRAAGKITISGAGVTNLATDIIVVSGAYGCELTGFADVFQTTGSLYGLDRSTYKFYAPIITNVAGEIDEIILQNAIDDAEDTGSEINYLIGSKGVVRGYQNYMIASKRNTNITRLKGGYEVLDYNGMPLVKDKYTQYGCLFGLNKADWKLHEMTQWEWMGSDDNADGILSRVANKPVYEATLYKFGDLGCRKPGGQFKLYGITEY